MTLPRRALLASITASAVVVLAGCDSPAAVAADAVILDVRTPAEFAAGHLDGAVNVDVQASDFGARIAKLDKAASYFVYCRSGNRSAQAITAMKAAGFTHLVDGGGMEAAAKTAGKKIVR